MSTFDYPSANAHVTERITVCTKTFLSDIIQKWSQEQRTAIVAAIIEEVPATTSPFLIPESLSYHTFLESPLTNKDVDSVPELLSAAYAMHTTVFSMACLLPSATLGKCLYVRGHACTRVVNLRECEAHTKNNTHTPERKNIQTHTQT